MFYLFIFLFIVFTSAENNQCTQSLEVSLSHNYEQNLIINENDQMTNNYCENTDSMVSSVYVHLVSESNEVFIDTCNSSKGISEIEIVDSCENANCLIQSTKQCGHHSYLQYTSEKPIDIIVRFMCLETPCELKVNYEIPSEYKYHNCINPMVLNSSFNETFNANEMKESQHGCQETIYSKGKWYKLEPNMNKKVVKIDAFITETKQRVPIEVKKGCDDYYCSIRYSEFYLDAQYTRYLYIYDDSEYSKQHSNATISVFIDYEDEILETQCSKAKQIDLPYSIHSWNYNQPTCTSECNNKTVESQWFTFKTEVDSTITISTISSTIISDIFISVSSGNCDSLKCIQEITSNSIDKGAQYEFIAQHGIQYNIQIGALLENLTSEFIVTIIDDKQNEQSKSTTPEIIETLGSYEYTIVGGNSYKTIIDDKTYYGMFVSIESNTIIGITLSTCSSITNTNSVIYPITNQKYDESTKINTIEIDKTLMEKNYYSNSCASYGQVVYSILPESNTYSFFIGSSSNNRQDIIHLTIDIEESDGIPSDENKIEDYQIVLIVVASILVLLIVIIIVILIIIQLVRRKNNNYNYDKLNSEVILN